TVAPSPASRIAVARPIPSAAPVTIATWPACLACPALVWPSLVLSVIRAASYAVEMTDTITPSTAARFVGQSVTRKEDARLLTGHGEYVDDVSMPRMLHAAFVRSEIARAAITNIDRSAALAAPGVVAVYTWQDFHGKMGEAWHAMLGPEMVLPPPLAIGDVRYVGDTVALVVAESRAVAGE